MLVLTRKTDQTLIIDGGIEIKVLQVKGRSARIGIRAPEGVGIVRAELLEQDAAARTQDVKVGSLAASISKQPNKRKAG